MSPWPVLSFLLLAVCSTSEANPQDCHATAFIGITYRDREGSEISIKSEIGVFAEGYALAASGELYRAYDGFGDLGCATPWQNTSYQRVALVRRGGCTVETKIENAIRENASAVIIYNNRDSLRLSRMKIASKYRGLISVVFTYKWKGDELIMLLDSGVPVLLDLSVANPCVADNFQHDRNMQLVSISFLCFIVLTISLAWLVFYHVQRYRDIQARERKAGGYTEADEKALKAIPTKTIKANDKLVLDESECCAICIDPYKAADIVRTLVCNHEFHKACIDPWLLENRTCPMCKKDILRHYGSVFTGSQESIIQVMADEASRLAGPSTPASPEIQVVIVGNSLDNVEVSAPPSPIPCNSKEFLTQRVQPCNTDLGNIATSSTSLMTLDSAHEALDLVQQKAEDVLEESSAENEERVDSCEEISENVQTAVESMEFSENRSDAEENDDNDDTSSVKRLVPDKEDFTEQDQEEVPMASADS